MLSFKVQNYNCLSVKLLYFKLLVINVLHVSEICAGKLWFDSVLLKSLQFGFPFC